MNKTTTLLIVVAIVLSSSFVSVNTSADPRQPAGILGYVKYTNGTAVAGIQVTLVNLNTGEYANTTTDANGLFVSSLYAYNGETFYGNATDGVISGDVTITVDLTKTTQWMNITLGAGGIPPNCFFTYSPNNPCKNTVVSFTDSSNDPDGQIIWWQWNFGDGNSGIGKHVEHVYTSAGKYYVTLTVTDNDGLTTWQRKQITISTCDEDEEENETGEIIIPPPQPPIYPDRPYTVPDMYHMLKIDRLGKGKSVKVAVIDTGVTLREYDNTNLSKVMALKMPEYQSVYDDNGHGTWCNYAMAYGIQNYTKEGRQYSIKVISGDRIGCSASTFIEALDLAKKLKVDVVSISLGSIGGNINDEICKKIKELRESGIIVVCSAGNSGPLSGTIYEPAISGYAIAVGSVDPKHTLDILEDDEVSYWSSRGPVYGLNEIKPDVVAGGESIIGPYMNTEVVLSGTSMSTPIVAGGIAVVYSQHSTLYNTLKKLYFFDKGLIPHIFERGLEKSCYHKGDEYSYGHGIPNFERMDNICYWMAILYLIAYIALVTVIIITIVFVIHKKIKKDRERDYFY